MQKKKIKQNFTLELIYINKIILKKIKYFLKKYNYLCLKRVISRKKVEL